MKKLRILKLAGLAILTMIVLIIISVIEVAIYSYLINPGQAVEVYDQHAMVSAPWISCLFGFLVFFLVVRYWCLKRYEDLSRLALLFPMVYIILDMVIITASGANWGEFYKIFLVANSAKLLGSYTAYLMYRPKTEDSSIVS